MTRPQSFDRNSELVRRYQAGDAAAAEELLRLNAGLLGDAVRPFVRMAASLEYEDLLQEARLGLLNAARRFEVERGNRFSTYAFWWVRQAVQRALETQDRMIRWPSHVTNKPRARNTRVPDVLPRVAVSLDERTGDAQRGSIHELLPAPGNMEEQVVGADYVRWAMSDLNARQRTAVELRLQGYDLAEIGRRLGVTRSRAQQVMAAAAARMRRRLAEADAGQAE